MITTARLFVLTLLVLILVLTRDRLLLVAQKLIASLSSWSVRLAQAVRADDRRTVTNNILVRLH